MCVTDRGDSQRECRTDERLLLTRVCSQEICSGRDTEHYLSDTKSIQL